MRGDNGRLEKGRVGAGMLDGARGLRYSTGCWVPFLYSKFSIAYIAVVGAATAFNILIFFSRLRAIEPLNNLNDYLPHGSNLRRSAIPIFYYLRATEFCIPFSVLQLLLSLTALILALHRRNAGYLFCYFFLTTTVILTNVCLFTLWIISLSNSIRPAVSDVLFTAIRDDEEYFCQVLEPTLHCPLPYRGMDDLIARVCGGRAVDGTLNCVDWLTQFLDSYLWLALVSFEGLVLMGFGIVALVRSCMIGYVHVPVDESDDMMK
uniref:Tetraspanin n=1 Tax=Steinernema glaseri TaxID=37863 RepID=A0A1I7ZNY8_9BILA